MTSTRYPVKGIDIVLWELQHLEHYVLVVPQDETIPVTLSQHWRWIDSVSLRDENIWSQADSLRIRSMDRSVRALLPSSRRSMRTSCSDEENEQPLGKRVYASLAGPRAGTYRPGLGDRAGRPRAHPRRTAQLGWFVT